MTKLEFLKFGNAVSIDGKNMLSANSQEYDIEKEGFEFSVTSKRNPKATTWVGFTNVSEWRVLKSEPKAKTKS